MSFRTIYKKLAEVNIYHHYFLDDGKTEFDDNGQPTLKSRQLEKYNLTEYMNVVVSEKTANLFLGQKILFKPTVQGFNLFIKASETAPDSGIYQPLIELGETETFTFLLYVTDRLFENYSMVGPNPATPYYFSNVKPETEPDGFNEIDLETALTPTPIEGFEIVDNDTFEALSESILAQELVGLFGIIQLTVHGDDTAKDLLDADEHLKSSPTAYKIQLKNRSTIWNYFNPVDGTLIHTTEDDLPENRLQPLVKNGKVDYSFDSKDYPAAQPNRIKIERNGDGVIIKTISEIYIN